MLDFPCVAHLIMEATTHQYHQNEFMNLIYIEPYRKTEEKHSNDLSNFNNFMNGKGSRGCPKWVIENYLLPDSINYLSKEIERLLFDYIIDLPLLMTKLEDVLNYEVRAGFLSAQKRGELLSGSEAQRLAKIIQYTILQRKERQPVASFAIGMHFCNTELPRKSPFFVGREQELQKIEQLLETDSVLFLTGISGVGKSALAINYAKRMKKKYKNCIYIRYRHSFRETIQSLDMFEESEHEMSFQHRMDLLKKLKSDTLLLLDGMDTLPEQDNSFDEIMQLDCHVLVTTQLQLDEKSMFVEEMKDNQELMKLFFAYCPEELVEDRSVVKTLIDLVHRHTYAVIMLALTVKSGCITSRELVNFIVSKGLGFPNKIKISTVKDGVRMRQPFFDLLQGLFQVQALKQEQQDMLSNLTCIPRWGMEKRIFLSWSKTSAGVLCDLICLGWVQEEDNGRTVVLQGIIRDMVMEQLHPTIYCCYTMIRSVLNQCSKYEDWYAVGYRFHGRLHLLAECLSQMTAVIRGDSTMCTLLSIQISICSYHLAICDLAALINDCQEGMSQLDYLIASLRLYRILIQGLQEAQKQLSLLRFGIEEKGALKEVAAIALYDETMHLVQKEILMYQEYLQEVWETAEKTDMKLPQAITDNLTEAQLWTIRLLSDIPTASFGIKKPVAPETPPTSV